MSSSSSPVAILATRMGLSLADRIRAQQPDIDEAALHDEVQANLARGRFNLLIVGDGIREGVTDLVEYLTRDVALGYRLGLIELAVYRMPDGAPPGFILQPRILAQTTEIPRVVVVGSAEAAAGAGGAPDAGAVPQEDQIRAALAQSDPGLPPLLDSFLLQAAQLGIQPSILRSLTLHWPLEGLGSVNFGSIYRDGTIATTYICESASRAGDRSIGERYLEGMSALIPGSSVRREGNPWTWKVVVAGAHPKVRPLLEQAPAWLKIIADTQDSFRQRLPVGG